MPKLEDMHEFDPNTHTLTDNAKASIDNKLTNGGTNAPSTSFNSSGLDQSTFNAGTTFSQPTPAPTFNNGANPFGTPTSTFGNSTTSLGSSNAGTGVAGGGSNTLEVDKGFSDFINTRWRPLMAVIYMITCTTDFVIFPVLWSVLQAVSHGTVTSQWQPLTLQGAGLYHIAMGAVLGLAAYGRSQEKIAGKA